MTTDELRELCERVLNFHSLPSECKCTGMMMCRVCAYDAALKLSLEWLLKNPKASPAP